MDAAAQKAFADLTDAVVDLRRFLSAVLTADDPTNPTDEAGQRSVYTVNRYALHPTESMIRGIAGDVDELRQLVETIAAAPKPAATSSSTAKAPAKAPSKPPAAP